MKNFECYIIRNGLNEVKQIPISDLSTLSGPEKMKYLFHTDFSVACARNKKILAEHIEILESVKKPEKDYEKYQELQREIAKKYSKKDESGNPVTTVKNFPDGSYMESYVVNGATDKSSGYSKESTALETLNKAVIEEQKIKEKQFNDSLDLQTDVVLHKIKADKLPMGQSVPAMEAVLYFLEEDEPVKAEVKKKAKSN